MDLDTLSKNRHVLRAGVSNRLVGPYTRTVVTSIDPSIRPRYSQGDVETSGPNTEEVKVGRKG